MLRCRIRVDLLAAFASSPHPGIHRHPTTCRRSDRSRTDERRGGLRRVPSNFPYLMANRLSSDPGRMTVPQGRWCRTNGLCMLKHPAGCRELRGGGPQKLVCRFGSEVGGASAAARSVCCKSWFGCFGCGLTKHLQPCVQLRPQAGRAGHAVRRSTTGARARPRSRPGRPKGRPPKL